MSSRGLIVPLQARYQLSPQAHSPHLGDFDRPSPCRCRSSLSSKPRRPLSGRLHGTTFERGERAVAWRARACLPPAASPHAGAPHRSQVAAHRDATCAPSKQLGEKACAVEWASMSTCLPRRMRCASLLQRYGTLPAVRAPASRSLVVWWDG